MTTPHEPTRGEGTPKGMTSGHRIRLGIIAISVVAAIAGAAVVFGKSSSEKTTNQSVVATLRVPGLPNAVAAGPDALWAGLNEGPNQTQGRLVRLDLATGAIRKSVSLPGVLVAGLHSGSSLWIASAGDWYDSTSGELDQLDWRSGAIRHRFRFDRPVFGFAPGAGSMWLVVGREPATLVRIDPAAGRVVGKPIVIDRNRVIGLAYGAGAVWAAGFESGTLIRIDPATGALRRVEVGDTPVGIAVAGGSIWVATRGKGTVTRVDPTTMRVLDTIQAGENPTFVATSAGSVWVANQTDGTVTRIDERTGETVGDPIRVAPKAPAGNSDEAGGGAAVYSFAATGDSLWVTSLTQRTISRIDPHR